MAATYGEGVYGNGVGVTTPLSHKMAQVTEFTKTTTANLIRPGVLYNGVASLVTGRANMAYDVAPFSIVTTRGATSGAVKWANDGTVTVSTTAAPGSNSRIDVIYAWHREFSIDGVDSNPVIGVVQGTAAASPTVPSLAAFPGAIELARVLVPAGVTATNSGTTFTQTAPFTSTDGGTVAFRTTTEMNLWTTALTDQRAKDISTGIIYRYNGTAWKMWESDWITYTPTFTGFTPGSGGSTRFAWHVDAGDVEVEWYFQLGGAGLALGSIVFDLPAAMTSTYPQYQPLGVGHASSNNAGANVSDLRALRNAASTTQAAIFAVNVAGTYGALAGTTTTAPVTFATGGYLTGLLKYRAA